MPSLPLSSHSSLLLCAASVLGLAMGGCGGDNDTGSTGASATANGGGNGSSSSNGSSDGGDNGSGSANGGSANGGSANQAGGDWTMLGYDSHSQFYNPTETAISVETAPNLQVAWTADLGASVTGAPIQVGDRVYASGQGVFCFDANTGEELWHNETASGSATLAYSSGTIYVHGASSKPDEGPGFLVALDAEDGSRKWSLSTSDQEGVAAFSSPTIAGNLVIIGGSTFQEVSQGAPTFRGFVFAADKDTGQMAWNEYTVGENETGASLWSSVSISLDDNRVYAGTGNNYTEPATDTSDAILALNYDSGDIEWKNQRYEGDIWSMYTNDLGNPDYDFGTNPILFEAEIDGTMTPLLAAGQKSGDAHVLRRDTGEEVWTRSLGPGNATGSQGIFNNGAWDGERLLFACNGATSDASGSEPQDGFGTAVVYAVDPATGDILWERQVPGVVMGPITVANGVGFVGADHHLEAFDTATGQLLFKHTVDATIASAPTVTRGRVAFGSGLPWLFGDAGTTLTVLELP